MAKREFLMTEDHESLLERLLAPSMGVLLTYENPDIPQKNLHRYKLLPKNFPVTLACYPKYP